jgi:hypothetical protein
MKDFLKNLFLGLVFSYPPDKFKSSLYESNSKKGEIMMIESYIKEQRDKMDKFLEIINEYKNSKKNE